MVLDGNWLVTIAQDRHTEPVIYAVNALLMKQLYGTYVHALVRPVNGNLSFGTSIDKWVCRVQL